MKLKGKTILLTGSTSGIGYSLAKALLREGCHLILPVISLDEFNTTDLANLSDDYHVYVSDFSNLDSLKQFIEEVKTEFTEIDVIINCAGIGVYKKLEELSDDDIVDSFKINLFAPLIIMRDLIKHLETSINPRILNIGSIIGKKPLPSRSIYTSTKFALRGLSLSLSEELKQQEIPVTLATIGSVLTNFGKGGKQKRLEDLKDGKLFLDPDKLAKEFINILEEPNPKSEYEIYPNQRKDLIVA